MESQLSTASSTTNIISGTTSFGFQNQTASVLNASSTFSSSSNTVLLVISSVIVVGFIILLIVHKRMDNEKEEPKDFHDFE